MVLWNVQETMCPIQSNNLKTMEVDRYFCLSLRIGADFILETDIQVSYYKCLIIKQSKFVKNYKNIEMYRNNRQVQFQYETKILWLIVVFFRIKGLTFMFSGRNLPEQLQNILSNKRALTDHPGNFHSDLKAPIE